jgi:hypothetical protein
VSPVTRLSSESIENLWMDLPMTVVTLFLHKYIYTPIASCCE